MKRLIKKPKSRGFTLIELMIVVAIIGILAVLAIYGVSRYLKSAKTAEATLNVGQVGKNAGEALTREKMSGAYVAPGGSSTLSHSLCMTSTKVPATIPVGAKFTSGPSDWGGDATTGWACLKYTIDQPQYYQYYYFSDSTATTVGTKINAYAYGDLDGNSTTSTFDLEGHIVSDALILAPKPLATLEDE